MGKILNAIKFLAANDSLTPKAAESMLKAMSIDARPEFKEEQHPRDENGRFTSGGGGSKGSSSSTNSPKQPKEISHKDHQEIVNQTAKALRDAGMYYEEEHIYGSNESTGAKFGFNKPTKIKGKKNIKSATKEYSEKVASALSEQGINATVSEDYEGRPIISLSQPNGKYYGDVQLIPRESYKGELSGFALSGSATEKPSLSTYAALSHLPISENKKAMMSAPAGSTTEIEGTKYTLGPDGFWRDEYYNQKHSIAEMDFISRKGDITINHPKK